MVVRKVSRDVIGYEDSKYWCVSILLLSLFNSRLLLAKLRAVHPFSRS